MAICSLDHQAVAGRSRPTIPKSNARSNGGRKGLSWYRLSSRSPLLVDPKGCCSQLDRTLLFHPRHSRRICVRTGLLYPVTSVCTVERNGGPETTEASGWQQIHALKYRRTH